MTHKQWINKALNIRSEETKPVLFLMLFSFFIGLSLTFYFTASNAIFLKHFAPRMIPVSFIASGAIVYVAWLLFSQIDKRSGLSRQVTIKFLFVFISVLLISIGVWAFDTAWLAFIMYTWVRVMVYITLVNFWGVAGRLFNIRQGKRIFGLISIGEVISIIIGYFSIPLLLQFIKVPDLLFLASFSLFLCLIMVFIIFNAFGDQLQTKAIPTAANSTTSPKREKPEWNYWNLIKKPYFLLISLMALLPIFGYLFVDFLFLAQTKQEFANNPEAIARFFGIFLGAVAILELILKLLSGRFLNKYGLKPSLLSLPAVLLFSILLAAVFGTLYGTAGMFFIFIAMARFFERSIRGSLYEPGFQLLYQPVPADQRLPFQNQIEGIPKALGTVITGCVILLFSVIPYFNIVYFNWIFILILGFWIWVAFKMYHEYRNMIKTKLSELRQDIQSGEDPMHTLIRETLSASQHLQKEQIINLFEKTEPIALGMVIGLDKEQQETHTFEQMAELSQAGDPTVRVEAAQLLGSSGRYNSYKLLINLMKDTNAGVKRAAIISAGKIRRVELWPYIIENLPLPGYSHAASIAIKTIGDPILSELDRFFEKVGDNKPVQLQILKLFESIGGVKGIKYLRDKIYHTDSEVRFQVLLSLSNLAYRPTASEIQYIKHTIEEAVETLVWILASLIDIKTAKESEHLQEALHFELEKKKEHIFLLLSLLYDANTIGHIRSHIESQDTTAKIYALEISDMMISGELKELFFPIFEDLSIQERLSRLTHRFPQERLPLADRLNEIINSEYSTVNRWVKACAIRMIGTINAGSDPELMRLLAAQLVNPDPLLGETAAWVLSSRHNDYYNETLAHYEKVHSQNLAIIDRKISSRKKGHDLLTYEKVSILKNTEFFAPVDELQILKLIPDDLNYDAETGSVALNETQDQEDLVIHTRDNGSGISISKERLFGMLTGDPVLTERYIRLFIFNTTP